MVADGGIVKAKLILDSGEFTAGWKKALGDLNQKVNGPDLSGVKKNLEDAGRTGQKAAENIKQINNTRFDKLASNLEAVMRKMQNSSNAGIRSIGSTIGSGLNAINFGGLDSKFSAVVRKMQSTAASGAKAIVGHFSSMEASLGDIFATVAGGAGLHEIFMYGMGRATTETMLSNSKSPTDASAIMEGYKGYTVASSTPDTDIQRVLKYVIQSSPPKDTYRALSAIDAAAFTPDPVQRQELLRNYGQYLSSGYSAALFRGDVTPQEEALLKGAETPEERIAAMEQVAKGKGSMTETGENLSTLTTGPMANYNKALIITDTLMRGMTEGFNQFMDAISPLMDWFIALSPEAQNTIGKLIFFAGVLGMAGGAVKVLGSLFGPVIGIMKGLGKGALQLGQWLGKMLPTDKIAESLGKLKDIAADKLSGFTGKVSEVFSGLKDKISGPLRSFKDAVVSKFGEIKDWIQSKWNPKPTSTGTTGLGTVGGLALGAGAVLTLSYATVKIAQASITTESITKGKETFGESTATLMEELKNKDYLSLFGQITGGLFTGGTPLEKAAEVEKQKALEQKKKQNLQDWGPFTGIAEFFGQNPLKSSGTVHAADGKGGKPSIMDDILGEKGLLRGTKLDGLKWPSASQILNKLKDILLPKIPKFNWEAPNVSQILHGIWDKINPLNWEIPGVGDLLNQTWLKIQQLFWNIPDIPSILGKIWERINQLVWPAIDPGAILGKVAEKILPFSWPWGPAPVGQGSGGGGGGAFRGPPRGPLSDRVSSTIASRSGLGQGNITGAMANRFKGLGAFNNIANGMADHLSYEFYFGDQKSNKAVWDSGTCNCYDGAQFLMDEASRKMGLGAGLTNGLWNGTAIPHTWATIGGQPFDMAGMLLRGSWAPPSGPAQDFAQFMTDIGPGLEYEGYGGHGKDPFTAINDKGNCFDMTLGFMDIASTLFGLPSEMVWGTYEGNSHVWLRAGGRDYDPTRRALASTYTPPPQGPSSSQNKGGDTFHIEFSGPVYGADNLEEITKSAVNKVLDTREKKRIEYSFG